MSTQNKIIQILKDYSGQDNIAPETLLIDLNLDSLDHVEISFDIQDQFGIDIAEDALGKIKTVKDLIIFIDYTVARIK
jgi:acyl carrier protein